MAAPKSDIEKLNELLQAAYDQFWFMVDDENKGGLQHRQPLEPIADKAQLDFDVATMQDMVVVIRIDGKLYRADFKSFEK
jgi:hypothetical protein